jgi:rRNA maturation endonuclease Nob1
MISLKKVGDNPTSYRVICANSKCRKIHYSMGYTSSVCPVCGHIGSMPHSIYKSAYSRIVHHNIEPNKD